MKIAIIGSHAYQAMMADYKKEKEQEEGVEVRIPAFDSKKSFNELDIITFNRELIEWCDEVHLFWDQRSQGTIFDFGMTFALRKRLVIVYLEPKTFRNAMELYEEDCLHKVKTNETVNN